ncbi:MAG: twin-arginine translocation signal domain-containing protein [Anaerolineales bacterium]|nr:twin-arginine translocation signal domain-containing protein [Anaerolineales bacterium]
MTESKSTLTRRDALKTLAAITGAVTLSSLPNQWEKPLVEVGALPAHAQTSVTGAVQVINNTGNAIQVNMSGPTIDNTQTIANGRSFTWSNLPPVVGVASAVDVEKVSEGYHLDFGDSFKVNLDGHDVPFCTPGTSFPLEAGELRTYTLTECPN